MGERGGEIALLVVDQENQTDDRQDAITFNCLFDLFARV